MSEQVPQANDPSWDRFAEELKSARAPFAKPPSANEVARLLQRAEAAENEAPAWTRLLLPVGAAAVVIAGVDVAPPDITFAVALRLPSGGGCAHPAPVPDDPVAPAVGACDWFTKPLCGGGGARFPIIPNVDAEAGCCCCCCWLETPPPN